MSPILFDVEVVPNVSPVLFDVEVVPNVSPVSFDVEEVVPNVSPVSFDVVPKEIPPPVTLEVVPKVSPVSLVLVAPKLRPLDDDSSPNVIPSAFSSPNDINTFLDGLPVLLASSFACFSYPLRTTSQLMQRYK